MDKREKIIEIVRVPKFIENKIEKELEGNYKSNMQFLLDSFKEAKWDDIYTYDNTNVESKLIVLQTKLFDPIKLFAENYIYGITCTEKCGSHISKHKPGVRELMEISPQDTFDIKFTLKDDEGVREELLLKNVMILSIKNDLDIIKIVLNVLTDLDLKSMKLFTKKEETKETKIEEVNNNIVEKKSWEEFRDTGLLWFINSILHLFGWAICYEYDDPELQTVYPAKVGFRGFSEDINSEGYYKITKYLKENIDTLLKDSNYEDKK